MTAETLLETNALGMTIGRATLLQRTSIQFRGGETVAIVGPNGAGKSTLLRLLSGDLPYREGEVRLKSRNLQSYSARDLARHRFMLSQHVNVSFPFSVEEIVSMGAADRAHNAAQSLVGAALDELQLNEFRHREILTLSGGEQQRAQFARVLVQLACGEAEHGPGVLLLDEPTSSLDLRHQINIVEVAKRRAATGTAVIAVLHDLNLAVRFADRIVVLCKGSVTADGTPAETITSDIIRRVFDIETAVGLENGNPFVLLQRMECAD